MPDRFDETHDPHREWQRFLDAQVEVEAELERSAGSLNQVAVDIFAVHQLILHDKTLTEAVREAIFYSDCSAAMATYRAMSHMADMLHSLDDEYFASRAADVIDVGKRLLIHLGALAEELPLSQVPMHSILLARDLTPADIAQLGIARVRGIALAYSTPTAHTSILARSLDIPLVCALGAAILQLPPGTLTIIDGDSGSLLVDPSADQVEEYDKRRRTLLHQAGLAVAHARKPARTCNGIPIPVYANANSAEDVTQAEEVGADGIGLLRTEYLFQSRGTPPHVDEQVAAYRRFAMQMAGRVLTIRALDAGGDKPVEYVLSRGEENPFLGMRGIRLLLQHPDLLREQYRALLTVRHELPTEFQLRFMLPMISTVHELETARGILAEVEREEASNTPRPAGRSIQIGALIEVPSAALLADRLAIRVDYLSIGTNDLAQYTLASDRTNSSVAELADPLNPSVLHLIHRVCRAAETANIPVSLCGEIAGNHATVPLLLGLGINELSVPLPAVAMTKQVVRQCDLNLCRVLAHESLACDHVREVRSLLTSFLAKQRYP